MQIWYYIYICGVENEFGIGQQTKKPVEKLMIGAVYAIHFDFVFSSLFGCIHSMEIFIYSFILGPTNVPNKIPHNFIQCGFFFLKRLPQFEPLCDIDRGGRSFVICVIPY